MHFGRLIYKGGVPTREGRGARDSAPKPELHLPRRLARSLAPPHGSRPCFSGESGKERSAREEAGMVTGREGVGGGGRGGGRGRGPAPPRAAGRPSRGARTTPRLARLQRLGPRPQPGRLLGRWALGGEAGPGAGARGAAAERRPLHLSAVPRAPARVPQRPPPVYEPPARAPRGPARPRLPAARFLQEQKACPGPPPPWVCRPSFRADKVLESFLLTFRRCLSQVNPRKSLQ